MLYFEFVIAYIWSVCLLDINRDVGNRGRFARFCRENIGYCVALRNHAKLGEHAVPFRCSALPSTSHLTQMIASRSDYTGDLPVLAIQHS